MRHLPPLNALRSFEAAARLGSFNLASEELYVTPSAVSHQIKSLEEFLNIKLFRREKRQALLTSSGERYLSAIEHALDEIDLATRRLLTTPNVSAINLSVVPAFLSRWLVPRIRDFQESHPDVELRLSAATGLTDFTRSDTDMAIYFGRNDWTGVESHHLKAVTLLPVCSPSLLESGKPLKQTEDLLNHTLLHVTNRSNEWDQLLDDAGVDHPAIKKGLTFSSTSLAINAAIEGVGIALADRMLVEREVRYGQLVIPLEVKLNSHRDFYLVHQRGRQLTSAMRDFIDWLLAELNQDQSGRENPKSQ
ncbi:MAG: transcriptional regulator GcvA [Candidatus Sedimenticola sp. (ex Thyasira tokunagai)]